MRDRRLGCFGIILLAFLLLVMACSREQEPTPLPGCEGAPRPIVFVHGLMGGGDNFANTLMRFESNGYCPQFLRTFDWNTLSFDLEGNAKQLSDFVDAVLEETGADQVDLVGHSMGGRLSHAYLSDQQGASQVAHYVHSASFCNIRFPDSVPVLVLSSDEDTVVGPCALEGAENQDVDGADHLQMVTLPEVFEAMYRFFNDDRPPTTTDIPTEAVVTLSGKVLTFGMNQPVAEAVVEVYTVDATTGERLEATPIARFVAGQDGLWGPFQADPSAYYEFLVSGTGPRPFHYYRQPFPRSNSVVYLRVLPEADLLLNAVLGDIHYDDRSSVVVFFSANQALYYGRDTATLNGLDLVTPEMAPPPPDPVSTIAIFVLDSDADGQTDGGPVPLEVPSFSFTGRLGTLLGGESDDQSSAGRSEFPFLRQYDAFLDASERRTVTLTMNGATLRVPTWKADSEGVVIVVFDRGKS